MVQDRYFFHFSADTAMKSYEETKDNNEREPTPPPGPDYPEEVKFSLWHISCFVSNVFPCYSVKAFRNRFQKVKISFKQKLSYLITGFQ